jgi:hypothetical protein
MVRLNVAAVTVWKSQYNMAMASSGQVTLLSVLVTIAAHEASDGPVEMQPQWQEPASVSHCLA